MKLVSTGVVYRLFKKEDNDTILRKANIRRLVIQFELKHTISAKMIFFDKNEFISKINPYNITKHDYVIPRIRNIETAAKEWNKNYPKYSSYRLKLDEVRYIVKNSPIYRYKFGNRWLVNYDQLETFIKMYIDKKAKKRGQPYKKD